MRERTFDKVSRIAEERGGRCLSTAGDYDNQDAYLWFECREGHKWIAKPNQVIARTWCRACQQRLTLDDLRATAAERGGECLATEYTNNENVISWRCAEGHEWQTTVGSVRSGRWCPRCAGRAPKTLEDLHAMAAAQGGECLSRRVGYSTDKYRWRCRIGHEFRTSANSVQNGSWCPRCNKNPTGDIERMRKIARRHGGECLSTEYLHCKSKLSWRCGKGHEWEATPENIVQGTWCERCCRGMPNRRLTIEDMHALAVERGGECLSVVYVNSTTKLRWRCASGHEFELEPAYRFRHWCPECALSTRGSIDAMHALAFDRGGRCLSDDYVGHRTVLKWACGAGHVFKLNGMAVKSGAWCPRC